MLGYDEFTDTTQVFTCLWIRIDLIVFRAMNEANDVGILLDSS